MNKPDYDPRSLFDLGGKRILVTGASMGLGKRFGWTLARAGAEVILAARSADKLRELSDSIAAFGGKCVCVSLDVRDRAAIRETVESIEQSGPIDVLGDSPAGVMHNDLRYACLEALKIDRRTARAHAEKFSWQAATEQFVGHLHPARQEEMVAV